MANVGSASKGKVYRGNGNGASGTYDDIGAFSGLTPNGVVISQGDSPFTSTAAGTSTDVLTSNGLGFDPTFQPIPGASPQSLVSLGNVSIDFKSTGDTLLFTTGAKNFFPTNLALYGSNIAGGPGFPEYSIGWTAPNYAELGPSSDGYNPYVQGATLFFSPNPSALQPTQIIPPNSDVYITVTNASSGTTDTEVVSVVGFYLP